MRFLQFMDLPAWDIEAFGNLIVPVNDRAGTRKYVLMSVTSGVGLVPQIEKFGREIAGNAYSNYYVIKKNDFAYNKSATKQFPEGYISMLTEYEEAALPNSIFTCFRIVDEECVPKFFDYMFQNNYHGSWLRKYIEVGARAHGSLSVDTKHLWNMPVALPRKDEQKKIADCFSSLDDLIAAEDKKLEALKAHKKGLMQKLFPAEGKNLPEWRFPKFRNSAEWKTKTLNLLAIRITTKNHNASIDRVLTNSAIGGIVDQSGFFERKIVSSDNLKNYFIMDDGDYVYNPRISTTAPVGPISKNKIGKGIISPLYTVFRFHNTQNDYFEQYFKTNIWHDYIKRTANTGARYDRVSITTDTFMNMPIIYPATQKEQQEIADCLFSIDNLIIEQSKKIEVLKTHKKCLMQGLFPSIEEVRR